MLAELSPSKLKSEAVALWKLVRDSFCIKYASMYLMYELGSRHPLQLCVSAHPGQSSWPSQVVIAMAILYRLPGVQMCVTELVIFAILCLHP